jgi:murein DD-endopeptidase MepM/ murein hydrolase activator NlpD
MKKLLLVLLLTGFGFFAFAYLNISPTPELSRSLVFPVSGKSKIGSFWGDTRDGGKRSHEGIDIFAKKGTPVVALCDGIIVSSATTPRGGKNLWLQSFRFPWRAYYAHLDQKKVREGQFVRKGQVIGTVGNTGNAKYTPSHLHFGIYKMFGGAVNPLPWVKYSKKTIPTKRK